MTDVPDNANEHCPGTESENAGKSSACAGCPNQNVCASGEARGPDPALVDIKERMMNVKHKILVLSGKGGVGKSTFSAQLSFALSQDEDTEIGLLDLDLCGPSIPRMLGLEGEQLHQSNTGWTPAFYSDNLGVVSIGFMLPHPDKAVIWRGPKKNGLIKNFLKDVEWGDMDYLIVDTPPGTSDEHITVVQYMKQTGIDGAVIVTTPQDVACNDVKKEINFCRKTGIPVLGVVENMSGFVCPNCSNQSQIFKATSGGGKKVAEQFGVPFLGTIPMDPRVMHASEQGESMLERHAESPASQSFRDIVKQLRFDEKETE
eukprot:gb/GECH01012229.1/.p1 GENE.gb/GECH01012229.1/~~gb/GECH01012229.1/.p1  ORF type:complete len:316 (+),score=88.46 gb/GECH01012229.1/:1-948(+)